MKILSANLMVVFVGCSILSNAQNVQVSIQKTNDAIKTTTPLIAKTKPLEKPVYKKQLTAEIAEESLEVDDKSKKDEKTDIIIKNEKPIIGNQAPEFSLKDASGKMVSLSSFKGKYVLIDFWASWCTPCRFENKNVVAAYTKYKNKNFTILGVSLDEKKSQWVRAIKEDKLTWTNVSDLKGFDSMTVDLYEYDGIPYNVLIDPNGKIIATYLRGEELEKKLRKVLR